MGTPTDKGFHKKSNFSSPIRFEKHFGHAEWIRTAAITNFTRSYLIVIEIIDTKDQQPL